MRAPTIAPSANTLASETFLEFRGVAYRDTVATGTLVMTSGLGGVYPKGIPIGRVLLPSRIANMRGDFQSRLESTLRRETAALQDELEAKIRTVTQKQIEGLSEIAQL